MFENFDECMNELVSIVNNARAIQQSVTDYGLTYVYRNLTSCFELVTGIRKEVEGTGRLEFLALGEQLDERRPSWRMRFEEEYDIVKYIFFVIYGIELGNIFERDISEVQNGKISFYEDEKINEMLKECISFIRSCPKIERQYNSRKHVFISKSLLEQIIYASEIGLTINEFLAFFKKDDRTYVGKVLDILKKIEYIYEKSLHAENMIDTIYLKLTNACNLRCSHCITNSGEKVKEELDLYSILEFIDKLKEIKVNKLIITGGEPLLKKDFNYITEYLRKKFKYSTIILSTNSLLIDENNINFIKMYDKVEISIDGVDEESCSKIRGEGVFKKVLEKIDLLQKNGYESIGLSMVFGEKNKAMKDDFLKLNKKLKTTPLCRSFEFIGRGYTNYNDFYKQKYTLPLYTTQIYCQDDIIDSRKISSCACGIYKNMLFIDVGGDVYPCHKYSTIDLYKMFNVRDIKVSSDIIFNIQKIDEFEKIITFKGTKCEKCDVNIFCWSCPAIFEVAKKSDKINLWCDRMKNPLNKIVWRAI